MRLRQAAFAVCLAALPAAQPAAAQQPVFSATDLPLVVKAYVEAAIDTRAVYETCVPADKRPGDWERGAYLLKASLSAAGLDAGTIKALDACLSAPVVPLAGDCAGDQVLLYSGLPPATSWADYHRASLSQSGLRIVDPEVADPRLDIVRRLVAETLPRQERMLVCLSLYDPQSFLIAFNDWNGLVARAAQAFIAAGFGAETYGSMLDGALARELFSPPSDRVAMAADCKSNEDWRDRFSTFAAFTFVSDVETALSGGPPRESER